MFLLALLFHFLIDFIDLFAPFLFAASNISAALPKSFTNME